MTAAHECGIEAADDLRHALGKLLAIVACAKAFAERVRLARRVRDEQVDVREAVRTHPELRSAFLSVRAAEEFAARKIQNPGDRARFMELIKGAMAGSIQNGEPLPTVKLKAPAKTRTSARQWRRRRCAASRARRSGRTP